MDNIKNIAPLWLLSSLVCMALSACGSDSKSNNITSNDDESNNTPTDIALRNIIHLNKLTGNALKDKDVPRIESAKAQLGMRLFFSKSLGGDRDSACVTCHHPVLGGGDNLSLSVGVGAENPNLLGEGRLHSALATNHDAGPPVPRNAPTTFNVAAWNKVLFHDGRVENLGVKADGTESLGIRTPDSDFNNADPLATNDLASTQARFPVTAPEEMKGFNHKDKNRQEMRDFLASRLGGFDAGTGQLTNTSYWLNQFRTAFNQPDATAPELITEQNIVLLISEYERSQAFTQNSWRAYIEGNNTAISDAAKQGALIFFQTKEQGGADCASCHSGDLFSDEDFYNIAMPQIGRGKGDGVDKSADFGRFRETKDEKDKYAFRTPSLLNIEMTGPWSHAGAYTSLKAVVQHHLNAKEAIQNYDFNQLTQVNIQNLDKMQTNTQAALDKLILDRKRLSDQNILQNINLSNQKINQLIEFLKTLTDPCVKDRDCLSQWIPPLNEDPNGDQLDAVDRNSTAL